MSASKTKEKVPYLDTLTDKAKSRYLEKLALIGDKDPYDEAEMMAWTGEIDSFPGVTYPDIVNYLVNGRSSYTLDDLKAYKSLEAYNQFVCGWVRDVKHCTLNNLSVLRACVRHSQRMNDRPLKPWIIAKPDGTYLNSSLQLHGWPRRSMQSCGRLCFFMWRLQSRFVQQGL